MLALVLALALSGTDKLSSEIDRLAYQGDWIDAATLWRESEQGDEITPFLSWYARAQLTLALSLDHPDLAAKMDPGSDAGVPEDQYFRWVALGRVLEARTADAHTRWEAAVRIRIRGAMDDTGHEFQSCVCAAVALGGSAGRLLATKCHLKRNEPTAGDTRAAAALTTLVPAKAVELLPFPIGTTPFVRTAVTWSGPSAKVVNPRTVKLPVGYEAMRAEQSGSRLVVLAWSSRIEPDGEMPGGAYWLMLLENSKWTEFYLGVREYRPTELSDVSKVPLLAEDGVVRLEGVDRGTPGAKPSRFGLAQKTAPFLLVAPLAELTRDSDFDGLTDVLESRMRLDPTLFDSDWDGIGDGDDPAPRSHAREQTWPEFTRMVFERRFSTQLLISRERVNRPDIMLTSERAPPVSTAFRFTILSPAELNASRSTDPGWLGARVSVSVDETGNHAFVEFDEGWHGASFRIDRAADGGVTLTKAGGWVH